MTNPRLLPAATAGGVDPWEQALYAFLVEKGNRSGSRRTVEGYGRMLWPLFRGLDKTPDQVTPADVLSWSHGIGLSGRTPSATTIGARIACLSSYFRFLIRMRLATSNPCDALERPKSVQAVARGLSAEEVRRLLFVVSDTVIGRRDRALLLTFILTGRRRAEVIGLTAGDINLEGETAFYSYRGKGGKRGRRELPEPAYAALRATLGDAGLALATHGAGRVPLAGGGQPTGRHELDVLREVPQISPGGGARPDRPARPPPHGSEAPSGCRRVDRAGVKLPRPLEPGRYLGLSPPARG